jgi:hypothetical protein
VVRLRGIVVEQATAPSLFAGRASVLARSEYGGAVETRGIDFRVRLADGETLYVPARSTLLLGRADRIHGTPACGPVTLRRGEGEPRLVSALLSVRGFLTRLGRLPARELTIAPGDEIEVCGTIAREPAVDGETGFGRTPSVRAVLHPAGEVPALVHKRSAAAGGGDETEWAI